jgi:hypothetical protein
MPHHAVARLMGYLLEQSAEIIRTEDTLSRSGVIELDAEAAAVVDVALEDAALGGTMVPVTSILWPTCFLRSLSLPSSA